MAKKTSKPMRVLIIDDDRSYVEHLQLAANPHRIIFEHALNLEEGVEKFKSLGGKAFSGIILDVICPTYKKQEIAQSSFIGKALKIFDEIAKSTTKVVLTGETSQFETLKPVYDGTYRVFLKGSDQVDEMFRYLILEGEKLSQYKIASQYPDIFEIFEKKYLEETARQDLLACLEKMESFDKAEIKDNLGRLRRLQEHIYLALNKKDPRIVKTADIDVNGPKVRRIITHLRNCKYTEEDKLIDLGQDRIYSISSDYGSHVPNSNPKYSPTNYTVMSTTFVMLDLLLWFKGHMDS